MEKKIKCKCIVCGKEFEAIRKAKYCSPECNGADYRKKQIGEERTVKCLYCGKEFVTTHHAKIYCSDECCKKFHREKKVHTYHRKCELCGKEFVANNPNKKCCSMECAIKLMGLKHRKIKTSRKATPEAMAQEYERMRKNGVPVKTRKVDGMRMIVETRGQHCWSGGPSIARIMY